MSRSDPPSSSAWRASLLPSSRRFRAGSLATSPILASEALKEDLAPRRPGALLARVACAVACVFLLSLGVAQLRADHADISTLFSIRPLLAQVGVVPFGLWVTLCAAALLLAVAPFAYLVRATAMVTLGAFVVVTRYVPSSLWSWWASASAYRSFDESARLLAGCVLPAALLFRAHYRAYAGARLILAGALLVALPFLWTSLRLIGSGTDWFAVITGVIGVLSFLGAFAGFMGASTTALGSGVAASLLLVGACQSFAGGGVWVGCWVEASRWNRVDFLLAPSCLIAVGLFQLLARTFTADARRVNVFVPLE